MHIKINPSWEKYRLLLSITLSINEFHLANLNIVIVVVHFSAFFAVVFVGLRVEPICHYEKAGRSLLQTIPDEYK